MFIQKEIEQTSWTVKNYEEGKIIFKGIPIEHNHVIKEAEVVMHHVAQSIGEIEVCEEMKQLEGITEIEEFPIEYVFQDKEARSLMESLESSNIRMNKSRRDRKPNVFKINELCVFTSTMGDEDSKVVMKCYYIPKGGKNWKFALKTKNEKDSQGGIHTQFGNRIADRQTQEFFIAGRRGLDCKYNQEEDKYKHPNAMLI